MRSFNINLLGDAGVGKSSWIRKLTDETFVAPYSPTWGSHRHSFTLNTNHGIVILNLFDYAGQEMYSNPTLHDSDATILMFDLTSRISYKNLHLWKNMCGVEPLLLIGNKADCADCKVNPNTSYLPLSAKRSTPADFLLPLLQKLTASNDIVLLPLLI